jgi:hypothetical protein
MESLQPLFNILFVVLIYLPINLAVMVFLAVLFKAIDFFLQWRFPLWSLCLATAVLGASIMFAMLGAMSALGSPLQIKDVGFLFVTVTLVVNLSVAALMFLLVLLGRWLFKAKESEPFIWRLGQKIALVCYVCFLLVFFSLGLLGSTTNEQLKRAELRHQPMHFTHS